MFFNLAGEKIGEGYPVFIVAELSANHRQNFDIAVKTLEAAKESGANAIKLQTYTPDTMTIDCNNDYFQIKQGTLWDGKSLYSLYKDAYTPWEWHPQLQKVAESLGLILFSSPFDQTAVDFLEKINTPAYKIASFEITDLPLIKYIATKGKPIIISTGIATFSDIEEAIASCRGENNSQLAILKCTSSYPAPLEDVNLKTIPHLRDAFKTVVGLSDHTEGIAVAVASVALGAKIIEKHFILNKTLGGPDASFSMEPKEFRIMVESIRDVEKALGEITYTLSKDTCKYRDFSRSLFVVKDIKAGERFSKNTVQSIRPGYGLHPRYYDEIMGSKARIDIKRGTPLHWNLVHLSNDDNNQ